MHVGGQAELVTAGGCGLSHASAAALIRRRARIAVLDFPSEEAACRVTALGAAASFLPGAMLASDEAAYITGVVLPVDGGGAI